MNRSVYQFAFLLLVAVLYEAAANVPHQRHRHHRQITELPCISTQRGYLCSSQRYYPFESVSDVVNEVREILSSHPINQTRLQELDPEVYNFQSESPDVSIQNLPDDVGNCKIEVQEINPHIGRITSQGRSQNFYIVNIPSLLQNVVSVVCNCENSDDGLIPRRKCVQAYRYDRLLSLPGDKTKFSVRDFSLQLYLIPDGCGCN